MPPPRIPEETLADLRARVPLLEIAARHVEMRRAGRLWQGCCPFHDETTPSFYVYPQDNHFHCYGCGAHGDVISFVARAERCTWPQAVARLAQDAGISLPQAGDIGVRPALPQAPAKPRVVTPERDFGHIAARIWAKQTRPIRQGSPVAGYLAARRLWPLPESAHEVLREALLPYNKGDEPTPCLVARVDDPAGGFAAIHRTWIELDDAARRWGKWRRGDARKALGPIMGNAVRLSPVAPVLGVAEGIETALAAWRLSGVRAWSCIAAPFLEGWQAPEGVQRVVVFADDDAPKGKPEGTGFRVARRLGERLAEAGIAAEMRRPRLPGGAHGDYADALMVLGEDVAA